MNLETLFKPTSIQSLSNEALVAILRKLIATERKATAEIIEFIKEVARRRLYLEYDRTSLFAFLTEDLGYSRQSAQTRIDAARLMAEVPELKEDLKAGSLNLTQLGMVAKSVRQKNRETPEAEVQTEEKRSLLSAIKKHDSIASQKIVAKKLNLEIKAQEKKHFQADESLRVTLTLNRKQQEVVDRVKELISHTHPNPSMAELIEVLALDYIKRKDPLSPKRPRKVKAVPRDKSHEATGANVQESERNVSGAEPKRRNGSSDSELQTEMRGPARTRKSSRKWISKPIQRDVHQADRCCQWRNPKTGKLCGARFQLQIDHRHPVWAGGGNERSNLQLLCSAHNKLKFQRETGRH